MPAGTARASQHEAALKTCRGHCDPPSLAFSTQQIEGRYANIIKENLGKPGQAVKLRNGRTVTPSELSGTRILTGRDGAMIQGRS